MRKQFAATVTELMETDKRIVVLLGDIGVYSFREAFADFPERIYNVGVNEQAMIGMAAGLAKEGFIPIVHTIAPFMVERAFEQIKLDIGYQGLKVILVSVGASYDYSTMGCTHHCPADVALMKNIPGMRILAPGTPAEVDHLLRQAIADEHPYYMRLSERRNIDSYLTKIGQAVLVQQSVKSMGTVVAVGTAARIVVPALDSIPEATILYYPTVIPFDTDTLRWQCPTNKVLLVEPYYTTLAEDITTAFDGKLEHLACIGVPRQFIHQYGTIDDLDLVSGLTAGNIRSQFLNL